MHAASPSTRRTSAIVLAAATTTMLVAAAAIMTHRAARPARVHARPRNVTLDCTAGPYQATTSIRVVAVTGTCSGDGIVVMHDGITIDLNQHTLFGPGSALGVHSTGHSFVTVTNGKLQSFTNEIYFLNGRSNRITNIYARGGSVAIGVEYSPGTIVSDNNTSGTSFAGILVNANNARVIRNASRANSNDGFQVDGIGLIVSGNEAENNAEHGINVGSLSTAVVIGNIANGNGTGGFGDGIRATSPNATLKNNIANFNANIGIRADPAVRNLGGNTAKGNLQTVGGIAVQCINIACA